VEQSKLRGLRIRNVKTDELSELEVEGCFLGIGHVPNTRFLEGQIELDKSGYLLVHRRTRSSVNGVFAAGDVHDQDYRQAITASAMGCMAAIDAEKWLEAGGISDEDWLDGR
jgi:thioredoxin reductase (NADPH)